MCAGEPKKKQTTKVNEGRIVSKLRPLRKKLCADASHAQRIIRGEFLSNRRPAGARRKGRGTVKSVILVVLAASAAKHTQHISADGSTHLEACS